MSEEITFKEGDIVKSKKNDHYEYKVLKVNPKTLKVFCTDGDYVEYTCPKSIFFKTG